jgi:hypothetical protein
MPGLADIQGIVWVLIDRLTDGFVTGGMKSQEFSMFLLHDLWRFLAVSASLWPQLTVYACYPHKLSE